MNWDLSDLYSAINDPAIEKDWKKAKDLTNDLKVYRNKIGDLTSSELLTLLKTWEDLQFTLHKIGLFAGLTETTHVADPEITRFSKQIDEKMVLLGKETIFIDVELAQLEEVKWQEFLKAKELKDYRHLLEHFYTESKHTLTEPEEKIMAEKSQTSSAALLHLFQVTTDTLTFPWEGKKITLDELSSHYFDADPQVRQKTAQTLHKGLKINDRTTPAIYNALLQDKSINDRIRHFDFPEQRRFASDEVDKPTVDALIQAVNNSAPLVQSYYQLKKQILGVDKLYWWDRFAPLPQTKTIIPLEQGKTMVLEAYEEFSPIASEIVQNMFDKNHIDWLPTKNKQGGAFCAMSGREIYPYVLLNYDETPNDVMTVAHELGHAIHDVLAQENNVFGQTHPSLALAEIASTFGESLLFNKLINSSEISKEDKIALLMSEIEGAISTIHRQIAMFQFEQKAHNLRRQEGELAKDQLDSLWHETMRQPYGDVLIYTKEHKNTWMYIPHIFRTPFYVYSYSFAQLCTFALLQKYRKEGESFVPQYLEILKAGGSMSPKDNLARAGLDITKVAFWQNGLAILQDYIDQLEKLFFEPLD